MFGWFLGILGKRYFFLKDSLNWEYEISKIWRIWKIEIWSEEFELIGALFNLNKSLLKLLKISLLFKWNQYATVIAYLTRIRSMHRFLQMEGHRMSAETDMYLRPIHMATAHGNSSWRRHKSIYHDLSQIYLDKPVDHQTG